MDDNEADVAVVTGPCQLAAMTEYQCWFCDQNIDRDDAGAVIIVVEGLWRWADSTQTNDDPLQSIYAHSQCAKDRMAGVTMTLEPQVFGDDD